MITEYKDINNDNDIAYYFEDLLINTNNDCTLELKLFDTNSEQLNILIGQLDNIESLTIVNTLDNNVFKYWITLNDRDNIIYHSFSLYFQLINWFTI